MGGEDFAESSEPRCLLNAEVALILEHKLQTQEEQGLQPKAVFLKAHEYVNRVKQFGDKESTTRVRQDLEKLKGLQDFEIAQLGNLCPDDAEEAKTLIPSLQLNELPSQKRAAPVDSEQLTNTLQALGDVKDFR